MPKHWNNTHNKLYKNQPYNRSTSSQNNTLDNYVTRKEQDTNYQTTLRSLPHRYYHFIGSNNKYTSGAEDVYSTAVIKFGNDLGIFKDHLIHTGCHNNSEQHFHLITAIRCDDDGKRLLDRQLINRYYFRNYGNNCDGCTNIAKYGMSNHCGECGCTYTNTPVKSPEHLTNLIGYLSKRRDEKEKVEVTARLPSCEKANDEHHDKYQCTTCFATTFASK